MTFGKKLSKKKLHKATVVLIKNWGKYSLETTLGLFSTYLAIQILISLVQTNYISSVVPFIALLAGYLYFQENLINKKKSDSLSFKYKLVEQAVKYIDELESVFVKSSSNYIFDKSYLGLSQDIAEINLKGERIFNFLKMHKNSFLSDEGASKKLVKFYSRTSESTPEQIFTSELPASCMDIRCLCWSQIDNEFHSDSE